MARCFIPCVLVLSVVLPLACGSENIIMGYITGSQRLNDNSYYKRPGQQISGALTMALDEINADKSILPGYTLNFTFMETYGLELLSLKATVELLNQNVSAYIGPQETCRHEAKVAAAFNRPMISYVSQQPHIV